MLPLVLFFIFVSCCFVYGWPFRPHPPAGAGGGRCLSRTTLKILCSSPTWHTARNAASARFNVGLNATTRAQLSGEGPQESLATFIEWVLVSYKSPLTVDIADTSPTTDPEPSQPSPHCVEPKLELTADGEPEPTATYEPSHGRATELTIAPEPVISDQVR